MSEIGTLLNSLCQIGFIVYVLCSIADIKKILRDIQEDCKGRK